MQHFQDSFVFRMVQKSFQCLSVSAWLMRIRIVQHRQIQEFIQELFHLHSASGIKNFMRIFKSDLLGLQFLILLNHPSLVQFLGKFLNQRRRLDCTHCFVQVICQDAFDFFHSIHVQGKTCQLHLNDVLHCRFEQILIDLSLIVLDQCFNEFVVHKPSRQSVCEVVFQ